MAIKLNSMTEREIESIAEAFAEYQYEDGEEGLFFLFPDQEAIRGCLKALGLRGSLALMKALKSGGESLEQRMKKSRQDFLKIEMLAVTKPYQGQGYMRKVVDIAFQMAQESGLPCILDTDGLRKRDKYIHLGMEPAGTRKIGPCACLYDLIKPMDRGSDQIKK